ncbi:TIGR01440 family protein [Paenibacillus yanchengensis]|uniref:UPF0340 protein ACFSJH_15125 n=1 Tax=Paenibacillus yanchengensis TaxID=2035833 RepID=A0ABW4YMU3_9BACL
MKQMPTDILADQYLAKQVEQIVQEVVAAGQIGAGKLVVFGVSTSEIIGERIGTSGTMLVAEQIFTGINQAQQAIRFHPVFQCCEHLNRALVIEQEVAEVLQLEQVQAVPVPHAGGSMAAYAYTHMKQPVLVDRIAAHAAVDIGDTLIGMHLKQVAVPFRPTINKIGSAHVTAAYTRAKLIGGARAVYELPQM